SSIDQCSVGAPRVDQLGQGAVTGNLAKVALGFEHPSHSPPHGRRHWMRLSGPPSLVVAEEACGQEWMARFSHPGQEGGPSLVVAPRQRRGGEFAGAEDIPPTGRAPPDQPQARVGLQRDRPTTRTGGIEAGMFVLLGRPTLTVRIGGWCWLS